MRDSRIRKILSNVAEVNRTVLCFEGLSKTHPRLVSLPAKPSQDCVGWRLSKGLCAIYNPLNTRTTNLHRFNSWDWTFT